MRNTNFAALQKKTIVDVLQILYFTVQHIILSPQKPEEKPRHKPFTVSTTQPNFLIYSEAADENLYIRKCFQIYWIFNYILVNVSEYISLHHCLRIY